jgi:hypothetical protein
LNVTIKGKVGTFCKSTSSLTRDNFLSNLAIMEAFLTKEASSKLYSKSMHRIKVRVKALGVEVPFGSAQDAKAKRKRRAKQDAFIAAKLEAVAAAVIAKAEVAAAAAVAKARAAAVLLYGYSIAQYQQHLSAPDPDLCHLRASFCVFKAGFSLFILHMQNSV